MKKSSQFSPEVRERAVRLVQEHREENPSLRAAIESIAPKIGCAPQTLLDWVKAGTLDDTSCVRPAVSIWCDSAQPWVAQPDGIKTFEQGPTAV